MLAGNGLDAPSQVLMGPADLTATEYTTPSNPDRGAPGYVVLRDTGTLQPLASISPVGLTPAQIRHAYGFDQITFGNGIDPRRRHWDKPLPLSTPYDAPTIASDLHNFDVALGLPDPAELYAIGNKTAVRIIHRLIRSAPEEITGKSKKRWTLNGPMPSRRARALCSSRPRARLMQIS